MTAFTTSDGCTLDYRIDGPESAAHTLVVLHGWSQSRAMFDRAIPALAERYRVISYDQRGHGESGKPATGARIARLASDLHELLDHLDVRSADLLGHSMGASVLWSYLDNHGTSRVDSLVIVDQPSACVTLPWMDDGQGKEAGAILDLAGAERFVAALLGPDQATVRREFLTSMLTEDIPADDLERLYAENCKLPADFGAKLLLDHVMQDWRDLLPGIDVPTLVIGGEVSHVDAASQEWTASQIPEARLRVFTRAEGGAHFPFFEAPATFVAALSEFLESVPATS